MISKGSSEIRGGLIEPPAWIVYRWINVALGILRQSTVRPNMNYRILGEVVAVELAVCC